MNPDLFSAKGFRSAFLQMHTRSIGRQLESKEQEGNKSRIDGQKEYQKGKKKKKRFLFLEQETYFPLLL